MRFPAGADGPGGARDPHPESSHVQQQTEELQAGDGEAWERLCKYLNMLKWIIIEPLKLEHMNMQNMLILLPYTP